jgi:outer membrane protein OmpA-like peptidoglycan-associated protein/uncharacterized protein YegP (UPF0339 family)
MEDNYLIVREYEERMVDSMSSIHKGFIEFKHSNGLFYFAWIKNDKVFLRSEGYSSESSRDHGIHSVIKNRSDKNNYRTESAHGAHFLILLAGNNKEIARSYPMREEVETFIALNQIHLEDEVIASPVHEDNNLIPTSEIEHEEKEPLNIEASTTTVETKQAETAEETVISPGQIDEPTKIVRSPLLESFQRDLIEPVAEETKENKVSELVLDEFELDDEHDADNQRTAEQVIERSEDSHATSEGNKPIDEFIEMKTMADELYSNTSSKPQSKLGAILEEEEKSPKKSNWKWLFWLILILIIGTLLWWLFQMKGYEKVKRFSAKYTTTDTASIRKPTIGKMDSLGLDQASVEAKATWEKTLGGMVEIRLPDGSLIKVPENGTEKRLVEYLEAKCGTSELKKTWFDMDRIIFKSGTDILKEISNEQIILLAKIFKSYPKKKFKIGGYTDNIGDPEVNIRLSAIRAAAAARAIAAIGVDSTRMRYKGYGQEHPICPANDTEECRAKNRRVSIRVDVCE